MVIIIVLIVIGLIWLGIMSAPDWFWHPLDAMYAWLSSVGDWAVAHSWVILPIVTMYAVWKLAQCLFNTIRKVLLIKAVTLNLPKIVERTEPLEPQDRWESARKILDEFVVRGQEKVAQAGRGSFNFNTDGCQSFYKAAEHVSNLKRLEDMSYVRRRQYARWLLDAYLHLLGEHCSASAAYTAAINALKMAFKNEQLKPGEQLLLPGLRELFKLFGLTSDLRNRYFLHRLNRAEQRMFPPGVVSLLLARTLSRTVFRVVDHHLEYKFMLVKSDGNMEWREYRGQKALEAISTYQIYQTAQMIRRERQFGEETDPGSNRTKGARS